MRNLTLTFQIHHPFRLRKYRFFDIGNETYYYDDFENERVIRSFAENIYLPTNRLLLALVSRLNGRFKISFSISGVALDQFTLYAPEVIESFQLLAKTGMVEFICETYSHSLAWLMSEEEFFRQVETHSHKINFLFNQYPKVFKNTEFILTDQISRLIAPLKFKAVIGQDDKNANELINKEEDGFFFHPEQFLILKNSKLSEDFSYRLINQNLQPNKTDFITLLNDTQKSAVNLFINYEDVGSVHKKGIVEKNFLKTLPFDVLESTDFKFVTLSEINEMSLSEIENSLIQTNEKECLAPWLGNELQQEAFTKLYGFAGRIEQSNDVNLLKDWQFLQSTDHLYYMCSRFFSPASGHFNPYNNPYEAFMNYMNILDDFTLRLNNSVRNSRRRILTSNRKELVKDL